MAIALDQNLGSTDDNDASSTSITLTTSAVAAAGTLITLEVHWWSATATLSSITGTNGLSWTIQQTGANGNYKSAQCSAYAASGLASGVTIVANGSVASTNKCIGAASFTGCDSGMATDGKSTNTSNAWASPTLNTTNANDVLHATATTDNPTTSTTTGPAVELHDNSDATSFETWTDAYLITSSTGSYSIAGTWAAAGATGVTTVIAYKEATAAAAGGRYTPVRIAHPRVGPMALRRQMRRRYKVRGSTTDETGSTVTFDITIDGAGTVTPDEFVRTRAVAVDIAGTGALVAADVLTNRVFAADIAGAGGLVAADVLTNRVFAVDISGLGATVQAVTLNKVVFATDIAGIGVVAVAVTISGGTVVIIYDPAVDTYYYYS